MNIERIKFAELNGKEIYKYVLSNDNKMKASFLSLGGICYEIFVPDKDGNVEDITLHYSKIEDIYDNPCHFGSIIARYGNRIANAKINIDGKEYKLVDNDNGNNLHSGPDFFHRHILDAKEIKNEDTVGVTFSYKFKDMEQGYPGNMDFSITYTLNNNNELKLVYKAKSDKKTVFNTTSHTYFNLSGHKKGNLEDILVKLEGDKFTAVNDKLIPEGIQCVRDTVFDFYSNFRRLTDGADDDNIQIKRAGGFDHNFAIKMYDGKIRKVATAMDDKNGRIMEVFSDLEGIQLYCGNFIKDYHEGKEGMHYGKRSGFCLETQHFPNSVNDNRFISPIIEANKEYQTTTIFKFFIKK